MDAVIILVGIAVVGTIFTLVLGVGGVLGATRAAVLARTVGAGTITDSGPVLTVPRLIPRSDKAGGIAFTLERAGVALTTGEYLAIRTAAGLLAAIVSVLLTARTELGAGPNVAIALLSFLLGFWLPTRWVAGRRETRLRRLEDQLADALISMAKSLKAGVGLTQALEYSARETGAPLGPELLRVVRELQLGADPEVVFDELNRRIGSRDLEIAATAIVIQRRVGGNLSEILTNVSNTIRERRTIRNELHSLTAKQRLQGNVSALLPPFVALAFFAINPDVADALVTTTAGLISLAVGIFFELLGLWLVRRFAQIDV